jgi:hypothetical protein
MPAMANVTVKANNGTTDVVFVQKGPSGGDTTPAQWRVDAIGGIRNANPLSWMKSRWNANKTARRVDVHVEYPYAVTDTTTGVISVKNRVPLDLTIAIPQDVPEATILDAVAVAVNFFASPLVKSAIQEGYAPQ